MDGKIYLITNTENGKQYVGKTTGDVKERFHQHIQSAFSQCERTVFARDICKYGRDAFSLSILRSGIPSHLVLKRFENYYIAKRETLAPTGYNIMP